MKEEVSGNAEDWMDPGFLDRLRAMFLRLRKRRVQRRRNVLPNPASGLTREFKDYRHYVRQDDYRSIDWKLYARLERLFVRLYEEVREFHVHVVVDASTSMARPFGEKRSTALRLALALSYLGLVSQHRVSLYAMRNRVTDILPPLKGQGHIHRVMEALRGLEFDGTTRLREAFGTFRPSRQRHGVIFVLSDLIGQNPDAVEEALRHVGLWPGETHVIHLFHPWEQSPELEGEVRLVDVETGEARKLWLTRQDLRRYRETFDAYLHVAERACASRQVDYLAWRTDGSFEEMFLELMGRGSVLAGHG
jgi:uncharacterized protein (DUF58 family)